MVRRAKREDGNENVVSVRLSPGTLQFLRELQDRLQEATGIDWGRREVIEVAVARLHRKIFGGTPPRDIEKILEVMGENEKD